MINVPEIVIKQWGQELIIVKHPEYLMKKLIVHAGQAPSLQYHQYKHESFYILSGIMEFYSGDSLEELQCEILTVGDFKIIEPKKIHRMKASEQGELQFIECSTSDNLKHLQDVIRLQDYYGRV